MFVVSCHNQFNITHTEKVFFFVIDLFLWAVIVLLLGVKEFNILLSSNTKNQGAPKIGVFYVMLCF